MNNFSGCGRAAREPEDEDGARQHAVHPPAGRRAAARPRALRRRHAPVSDGRRLTLI